MAIHYARLESSPRLRRVRNYLTKCGRRGATTKNISDNARTQCVSTCICELRWNGVKIRTHYERTTKCGDKIFRYTKYVQRKRNK